MNDVSARRLRSFAVLPLLAFLLPMALFLGCGDEDPAPVPVLLVPDQYPTPQAAMDAAEPGDLITVRPGIYTHSEVRNIDPENFPGGVRAALFMKDNVYIQGLGEEPGLAILRDTTEAPYTVGAVFASNVGNTLIDNLAIEDYSVGVLMTGDSGQIQNSRISDCGIGAHAVRAEAPVVVACLIVRAAGAGILSEGVADGLYWFNHIRDCEIGIDVMGPGYVRVPTNLLCRNSVGLRISQDADLAAWLNSVRLNRENGVLLESGAEPVVTENDIYDNGIDFEVEVYAKPLQLPVEGIANFWNTLDTLDIMDQILDQVDDPARGAVVEYQPASPVSRYPIDADVETLCAAESPQDDAFMLRMLGTAVGVVGARDAPRPERSN